jgi:hypothetical protein
MTSKNGLGLFNSHREAGMHSDRCGMNETSRREFLRRLSLGVAGTALAAATMSRGREASAAGSDSAGPLLPTIRLGEHQVTRLYEFSQTSEKLKLPDDCIGNIVWSVIQATSQRYLCGGHVYLIIDPRTNQQEQSDSGSALRTLMFGCTEE